MLIKAIISVGKMIEHVIFLTRLFVLGINKNKGARFLEEFEAKQILKKKNSGFIIIPKKYRLTEEQSYKNILISVPTGAGKTSKIVIPNLIELADNPVSLIITDAKGTAYNKTSGYLKSKGYNIKVLDFMDLKTSIRFNPLAHIKSYTDAFTVSDTLIRASSPETAGSKFWNDGGAALIQCSISMLKEYQEKHPEKNYYNLHNVLRIIQNITDTKKISNFCVKYTENNRNVYNQLKGILGSNERVVSSYVSVALNALNQWNSSDIQQLTAENEVNFEELREKPTAYYIITPPGKIRFFSFFMSIFYYLLFSDLLKKVPEANELPVYIFFDEFANTCKVESFQNFITMAREYKISTTVLVQTLSQILGLYGNNFGQTIINGGFNTRIIMKGQDIDSSKIIESMLGKVIEEEVNSKTKQVFRREYNLFNADRIARGLKEEECMVVMNGIEPMILKGFKGYYEIDELRKKSNLKSHFRDSKLPVEISFIEI